MTIHTHRTPISRFVTRRSLAAALVSVLLVLGLAGCASLSGRVKYDCHRKFGYPRQNARLILEYPPANEWDARIISDALDEAVPGAAEWGAFRRPVTIRIHPTHRDLEEAVNRRGYPWLKAWARFDSIDLEAPSVWGGTLARRRVTELLTHELTHVVMYQAIGDHNDWYGKPIPLWFREGMASYAAGQGPRRMSREELLQFYLGPDFTGDPISEGRHLVRRHPREVYSAGHWMFADLADREGREGITRLLEQVRAGQSFREAWQKEFRESLSAFENSWRNRLLGGAHPRDGPRPSKDDRQPPESTTSASP